LLMAICLSATVGASTVSSPQRVRATGTATTILVNWSRPAGTVKNYVVTSKPAGRSCVTAQTYCEVKDLRLGVSYTFSVVARTTAGTSAPSAPSNRVRVATAGTYFTTTLRLGGALITEYEADYLNSATAAKAQPYLTKLSAAFVSLGESLSIEAWPSVAQSYMSSFESTFRSLGTDTLSELNATTISDLAGATDTLQTDTNKEILVEAKVRTDLSLPQLIISPIAVTPVSVTLGTAQSVHDFYDNPLAVTASQVVDPATAAPGSGLADSGYRFVAIQVTLANSGSEEITGDANTSMTVTGSDGVTYTADFGSVSGCTNFQYGSGLFDVPSDDSVSGCVVFELPTAISVQSISFSLAQGYLDTAEWSN